MAAVENSVESNNWMNLTVDDFLREFDAYDQEHIESDVDITNVSPIQQDQSEFEHISYWTGDQTLDFGLDVPSMFNGSFYVFPENDFNDETNFGIGRLDGNVSPDTWIEHDETINPSFFSIDYSDFLQQEESEHSDSILENSLLKP